MSLFTEEEMYGKDESPLDNTEINSTFLYYSKEEMAEFKKLCKEGIKIEFPATFQEEGNVSDFILKILRKNYGSTKTNTEATSY